jgi:hypothetical protein
MTVQELIADIKAQPAPPPGVILHTPSRCAQLPSWELEEARALGIFLLTKKPMNVAVPLLYIGSE